MRGDFALSPGQAADAAGRLLVKLGAALEPNCAMDRAYEGDETRKLVSRLGFFPVVPDSMTRSIVQEAQ